MAPKFSLHIRAVGPMFVLETPVCKFCEGRMSSMQPPIYPNLVDISFKFVKSESINTQKNTLPSLMMLFFIPQSTAKMCTSLLSESLGTKTSFSFLETSATRFRVLGSSNATNGLLPTNFPKMEPELRINLVMARVSTP